MTKYFSLSFIIALIIIVSGVISCTPQSCLEDTEAFLNGAFYKTGSDKPSTADSVTIFGVGKESDKIYSKSLNVSRISLPLDPSSTSCVFIVKINKITDTLTVIYSSYPHLISKECGISFFHTLDSAYFSGKTTDVINIMYNKITPSNEENIRIFY